MRLRLPSTARSALFGALLAVSVALPWSGEPAWWLGLGSLGLFAHELDAAKSWKSAAWHGWWFSAVWLAGSFWWLYISMHTYGGLPAAVSALAVMALAGSVALIYVIFCVGYFYVTPTNAGLRALAFAAMWLLAELARGNWLTGFSWGGLAYTQALGPLAAYAPWLGAFGITAVAAWVAISAASFKNLSLWQKLAIPVVFLLPWSVSQVHSGFTQSSGSLDVALLQGNIPQNEKFQSGSGVPTALSWYAQQLQDNRASLVVAPETAIPLLPQELPNNYLERIAQRYSSGEQAALIGIPLGDYRAGYTNSMLGFKPGATQPWRYDKQHLVPFGEVIPPFFKWFTRLMNIPLGDFKRGNAAQPAFEWQGQRLAANICYEDLFGEEMAESFSDPHRAPTIMVNSSNIAWFGNTLAIDQHESIARLRSLEFERATIRATNTGSTVIINHHGVTTHQVPRHTRGVLIGSVEGRTGITPYAWWVSRLGLWPLWFGGFVLAVLLWRQKRKQIA